jgi:hypothetical protein
MSDLAARRNEIVAVMADEVFIAHATTGGHLEQLAHRLKAAGVGMDLPR